MGPRKENFESCDIPTLNFTSFIQESPSIPGHSMEFSSPNEFPWFNHQLLQEGMTFVRRNYFSVLMSNFIGGFLMVTGKNLGGEAVYSRGSMKTPMSSFLRILNTLDKFMYWYESDLSEEGSKAFRAAKTVRKLHELYGEPKEKIVIPDAHFASQFTPKTTQLVEILRTDMSQVDTSLASQTLLTHDLPYSFSQFTVALNQLSLTAPLLFFPDLVGLNDKKDRRGYIHLMAVLGRLMGLEDRFNIALSNDLSIAKCIFTNVIVASWKHIEETNVQLNEIFIQGVNSCLWFPFPSFMKIQVEVFLLMLLRAQGATGKGVWEKMNLVNKLYWGCYSVICWLMIKSEICTAIANNGMRLVVWILSEAYLGNKRKCINRVSSVRKGCPFGYNFYINAKSNVGI